MPEHTHTSLQCMQGQPGSTHLDEKFAGAKDEARICVPNTSGKLAKGTRIAGMRVCSKKHFSCNGQLHMSILPHRACSYLRHLSQVSILKQTPTESSHAYLLLHNLAPLKCSSTC